MKKCGSSEAQFYKPTYLVFHSVIALSLSGGGEVTKGFMGLYISYCGFMCSYSQWASAT